MQVSYKEENIIELKK